MDDSGGGWKLWAGAAAVVVLVGVVAVLAFRSGDAQVSGTVTLDAAPVAGAQVTFLHADESVTGPLVAKTDDAGRFELVGNTGAGVPVGPYRVAVRKDALKDGSVPTGEQIDQARAAGKLRNMLPKVYDDKATTPVKVELRAGRNSVDVPLKSKP